MLPSSWQSNLDMEGSGRRNWETFVCGGLCCLQHQHRHQPCVGKGKVQEWESPTKGHQGTVTGWNEAETCAASLGTLFLLGGTLQS